MSDGSLCVVGDGSTPIKYTMGDGEVFVVDVKTGSPFAASGIKYIKSTGNTFSFSEVIAKEDIGLHLFTSGKEISSNKIDDNNKTKLILYDCSNLGVCIAVAGYAINGEKYYSIPAAAASAEVTPANVNVCSADSGKLIDDGRGIYLCTGTTNKVNLAQPGFYALDNNDFASGSSFASGDKQKMIQISDTLIGVNNVISDYTGDFLIKIDDTYTHYSLSSSTYTAPGTEGTIGAYERCKDKEENFINVYKKFDLSDTSTITEDSDVENWALFDCTSGSCTPTYGYIKSSDASPKYFSLAVDGTNSIVTDAILTSNACAAATNTGLLFDDSGTKKLCVDGTAETVVKVAMADSSLVSLSIAKPNVFAASEKGKTVIVKVKESTFTLSHSTDPYNVYKLDSGVITAAVSGDFTDATKLAKLGIYKCDGDVCENVSGYAFSTTYYAFGNTLGGTEVPNTITSCNGNVGKVATIGAKKYLCLTGSDKVDVTTPAAGPNYYVVGTVASDSKLAANKMVKITDTYIVTDERWDGQNYLVKKDDVFTAYNYDTTTKKFAVDSSVSGTKTYRQVESSNLYEELPFSQITLADAPNLLLFSCASGICEIRHGKILIGGTTVMTCSDTDCNTPDAVLAATTNCDGDDDVSKVFVDNKALKMCMKGTTPTHEVVALDSSKVYYAGTTTSTYKRLIVNDSKTIIMEETEIGYFLVRNNVLVSSYTDGDTVVQCTGLNENCSIISAFTATCITNQVGTFTSTKELCLNESGKKTGALGTEGSYLIAYGASSGFTPLVKSGQFGVIKMTAASIVPDTEKSYICVDANLAVTTRASTSATCATGGTAYACNSKGVCQAGSTLPELPGFPDCPATCSEGSGTATSYCIDSDNKFHGVISASACLTATITGVHVIDESTKFDVSLANTSAITQDSDIATWMIYDCDTTGICQRTYGYA
jgi:hypothetical protein